MKLSHNIYSLGMQWIERDNPYLELVHLYRKSQKQALQPTLFQPP